MFRIIRLLLSANEKNSLSNFEGKNSQRNSVMCELKKYTGKDAKIDGSKVSDSWFPEIDSDVFISHSHENEKLALGLKYEIEKNTFHKCFVDSSVWGNSADLLKDIDEEYCCSGTNIYNYNERNYSTSHVHMMLSVALQKMIFKSNFVIFLDTPESISVKETVAFKTFSPWIYSEISTAIQLYNFQSKLKNEIQKSLLSEEKQFSKLQMSYSFDLSNFENIKSLKNLLNILGKKAESDL